MIKKKVRVYHVSEAHTIHKGSKAKCVKCRGQKPVGTKKSGSSGGKKSSRKRSNPPRKCSGCKKNIHRQNKSGLCLACLREYNAKKAEKEARADHGGCSTCEKPISRINKSGLCQKCWNKSPKAVGDRRKSQAWINAAVFSRNATPLAERDSTDVP